MCFSSIMQSCYLSCRYKLLLMFTHIRLICATIKFTYLPTYFITPDISDARNSISTNIGSKLYIASTINTTMFFVGFDRGLEQYEYRVIEEFQRGYLWVAARDAKPCVVKDKTYKDGEEFKPNCSHQARTCPVSK